ncbi:LTA_synthase domain containing protein [Burkholderiaceae bacterium]
MAEMLICVLTTLLGGWAAEQWMTPTPNSVFRRPWRANVMHVSILVTVFGLYLLVLRRPWLASALTLGLPVLLIIINNTKHTHLREPFLASDWSYFVEALRYPRLYFPFFGSLKAALMLGTFVSVLTLWLWLEPPWSGNINPLVMVGMGCVVGGAVCLRWACLSWPTDSRTTNYDVESDVTQWGLFATLALYGYDLKRPPNQTGSPFLSLQAPEYKLLPHFIAIQAESFFDLKRHFTGHLSERWLVNLDALNDESHAHGPLIVPAWGANTVRTEFEFLTGLSASHFGVHRFQPYALAFKHTPRSLARYLKVNGYETIFVHPYLKNFYNRHRVMPQLGFDSFLDVTAFDAPASSENYVSDLALGETLVSLLNHAQGPTFLQAVTMAGHGPYTRKGAEPAEVLDKYAARMAGTDAMLGYLREALPKLNRPVVLCVYGDHPPILPEVYAWLGMPDGTTDYAVWCSQPIAHAPKLSATPETIHAHMLAAKMLRVGGFTEKLES